MKVRIRNSKLSFVRGPFIGNGEPYLNFYDLLDALQDLKGAKEEITQHLPFTNPKHKAMYELGIDSACDLLTQAFKEARDSVRI